VGGGVYVYGDSPVVTDNFITRNSADHGAGVAVYSADSPIITNNEITENEAAKRGGGILCNAHCSPIVTKNIIFGNSSVEYGGGVASYEDASPTFTNNIIAMNTAERGGGISTVRSNSTFINNTVTDNSASSLAGGIYCADYFMVFVNGILWDNTAPSGPEIGLDQYYITFGHLSIRSSDVEGGLVNCYVEPGCTLDWGAGMIDADPLFADAAQRDYHLTFLSPCKEGGDNGVAGLPAEDFEGDPRVAYGTADMGADEFHPHLYATGELVPSSDFDLKFIGLPGTLINGVILGVDTYENALPCDYGFWWIKPPTLIFLGFGTIPANGVSVLQAVVPASPSGPYTLYLQAVIDLWLTSLCTLNVL
jgi:hypothetical protein